MRPSLRFLSEELIKTIIAEARSLLAQLGVEINNDGVRAMLADRGARVDQDQKRIFLTDLVLYRSRNPVCGSWNRSVSPNAGVECSRFRSNHARNAAASSHSYQNHADRFRMN